MSIVNGYKHTSFICNDLTLKLRIPKFQLDILKLSHPVIVDSIQITHGGVLLLIKSKKFKLILPRDDINSPTDIISWWNIYKHKRACELLTLVKEKKETVLSIIKNEEALYLNEEPLSSFLTSEQYSRDLQQVKSNTYSNDEYQSYMKTLHYSNTYNKISDVNGKPDHLSRNPRKNKFANHPRLYIEKKDVHSIFHSFTNYGTHLKSFSDSKILQWADRAKSEQITGALNSDKNRKKYKNLKSNAKKSYEQYYKIELPITLIVDSIIVVPK